MTDSQSPAVPYTGDPLMVAFAHHRAGHLTEAGTLYRAVLDRQPDHPDALHLLGLVERRTGHTDTAIALIRRAIALRQGFIPALVNLADILRAAGRLAEAADCLGRVAELDDGNPTAWRDYAVLLSATGRAEDAVAALRRATERAPDAVDLRQSLMGLLQQRGRHAEAEAVFAEFRRRVPPNLRPFQHIAAARWCREVGAPATMLSEAGTRWVARPAENRPVGAPDAALPDDDLTAPGFTEGQTVDMRDHTLSVGDTFVAHLKDVDIELVSRVHGLRGTFNLFVEPGLALADAYHDLATTDRLLRFTGERVAVDTLGQHLHLDLYDAVPPDQIVEEPALLLASRFTHHNYFHWIFEGVARLWSREALPGGDRLPLLMHAGATRPFHRDVLDALGVTNPVVRLTGTTVRVKTLYFPSFLGPGIYAAPAIEFLRRRLLPAFGVTPWPRGGRRLYLSRADVSVRTLVNEEAMTRILADHGFETIVPGRMSVAEQVRTFAEAAIVVAPHGAGNTNMVFAPPGATLIELVPASTRALLYWITTKQSGQRYARLLCPEEHPSGRLIVDTERFAALLDTVLSS